MASASRLFRKFARRVLDFPAVKKTLIQVLSSDKLYPNLAFERTHPIDIAYGIDTSGFVPVEKISPDPQLTPLIKPYGASQPGIVRRALTGLGNIEDYIFADLGCGKGRAAIIASEFRFKAIMGVELSPTLANIARTNARIIARNFPLRAEIQIFEANVVDFPFPNGKLVAFMYHSFGRELLSDLIRKLENRLSNGLTHLFFVYCNPVHGDLFDVSPTFKRWYAESISCDPSEIGYGPETSDTVVIWESGAGAQGTPHKHADRRIIVTKPLWRAELDSQDQ